MSGEATQLDYEQILWSVADKEAGSLGKAFAPGCEQLVRGLAADGARQLVGNPERLVDAEVNLRRLVREMANEASLRGDSELHEYSLQSVMGRLCPLWPFC